jgi:hypothetical protein
MPRQRQAHRSGEAAPGRYPWPEAQNGGDVRPEGPRTASLSPTQMTRGSEPPPPSPCRSRLRFVGGRIPSERGREVLALVLRVRKSLVSLALPDYTFLRSRRRPGAGRRTWETGAQWRWLNFSGK